MARVAQLAGVVALAALAADCGTTSPSCTYSLSPSALAIAPAGGSATLTVSTGDSCSWTATANASWFAVLVTSAIRTGNGPVQIVAGPNTAGPRIGTLNVAGHSVTVTQEVTQPAQPYAVTGRVRETWTDIGMAGARVTFAGPDSGSTTTGRDGTYTLGLAPGTYQLLFSRPAFQATTMVINVSGDMTVNTNLNVNRPFPLPPTEVIGFWEGGGLYPDQPMVMTLIRDGANVSGWYRDQHSVSDGLTGTFSGRTLVFRVPVADGVISYECTIDDERRMHGLVKNERYSGGNTPIWFIRD